MPAGVSPAMIIDSEFHDLYDREKRAKPRPVVIEDDVWIGAKASVLPGVHIGRGSVVGTAAVVTADVPPFTVFGMDDRPALLLGTDLLETFRRVSLDFRARKVRFQLRKCGTTSLLISTAPTGAFSRLSADNSDVCRR